MAICQGIVRGGDGVVHCDRLDEFFEEFIEYRKWKAKTNNFNKNTFSFKEGKKADGNHPYNPEKDYYGKIFYLNLDNDKSKEPIVYGETPPNWKTPFDYSTSGDLGIKVSKAFKIKKDASLKSDEGRQGDQQKEKIEKVLKDIGATGKIKDTYGLDLNGPNNQQTNKSVKENQELQVKNEQFERDKKVCGIIGSLALVGLVGLVVWLILRKK